MVQTASSARDRKKHYLRNIQYGFDALSDLYYEYWGEFFHFALFEPEDPGADFESAWDRTHERYFAALGGPSRRQILEIACGGGAFSRWMADRTAGQVLGVDLSERQIARARSHSRGRATPNLDFAVHDVMRLGAIHGSRTMPRSASTRPATSPIGRMPCARLRRCSANGPRFWSWIGVAPRR